MFPKTWGLAYISQSKMYEVFFTVSHVLVILRLFTAFSFILLLPGKPCTKEGAQNSVFVQEEEPFLKACGLFAEDGTNGSGREALCGAVNNVST